MNKRLLRHDETFYAKGLILPVPLRALELILVHYCLAIHQCRDSSYEKDIEHFSGRLTTKAAGDGLRKN
jgi:hypothetical protein